MYHKGKFKLHAIVEACKITAKYIADLFEPVIERIPVKKHGFCRLLGIAVIIQIILECLTEIAISYRIGLYQPADPVLDKIVQYSLVIYMGNDRVYPLLTEE